ncbi:MAG: hypothetical protein U9Q08_02870 [Candidatus Omnitrophota bacterium]|nr:hypothetical protein [Candidatus Omnitrophota bacterium]
MKIKEGINQRGAIFFLTLIVLLFLTVFGGSLMLMVFSRFTDTYVEYDRLKALYLAEAGISKSLWELKKGVDFNRDGLGNIPKTCLGEGSYRVIHNPEVLTIISTGEANDIERTVRIVYTGNY